MSLLQTELESDGPRWRPPRILELRKSPAMNPPVRASNNADDMNHLAGLDNMEATGA